MTGNAYCGIIGAPERKDYTVIGSEVNMSARLMSKANGRILLDKNTYLGLSTSMKNRCYPVEKMLLKGEYCMYK